MLAEFSEYRRKMVDNQIRTVDVTDLAVLTAFLKVPREMFVPQQERELAYLDRDVLLSGERSAEETTPQRYLMAPAPLAKLIQLAAFSKKDKVLIIGAGTGYSAALVSQLVEKVYALEMDKTLTLQARKRLESLGCENVQVITGALHKGSSAAAPYDVILLEGSVQKVPNTLFEQLEEKGRLVLVEGHGHFGYGMVYTKDNGHVSARKVFNLNVRPLPGFEKEHAFVF